MWNPTAVLKITLKCLAELLHPRKTVGCVFAKNVSSWRSHKHTSQKCSNVLWGELEQQLPVTAGDCHLMQCERPRGKGKRKTKYCKCGGFPFPCIEPKVCIASHRGGGGVGSGGCSVISTTPKPLPLTCHFNCGRLDTPCHNTSHIGHPVSYRQVHKSLIKRET